MAEEKEILTLQQAKDYLRVSYDEDDEEIKGLILTAEAYIDSCVGTGYKNRANYESDEELPPFFKRRSLAICTK